MGRLVEVNQATLLERKLFDENTGRGVRAHVFDEGGTEFTGSPFTLAHVARGRYRTTFTPDAEGDWSVEYRIFTDGTFATISNKYNQSGEVLEVRSVDQDLATLLSRLTSGRATNLDNLDATVSSRSTLSAAAAADAVWDEPIAGHLGAGSTGEALDAASSGADPSAIADAVWDEPRAGHATVGTFGEFIDAAISSRSSHSAGDVWEETRASHVVVGSMGEFQGNLNATISSRATQSSVDTKASQASVDTKASQASVDTIDGNVDSILVDTGTDIPAQIAALNDPTAAAIADAVWDEPRSGHQGVGSMGEFQGNLDVAVSTRSSHSAGDVWDVPIASHLGAGSTGETLNNSGGLAAADIADAVWDEAVAGHNIASTFGNYIQAIRQFVIDINDDLNNPGFGLSALKDQIILSEVAVVAEVDANEVKIDAISAKTINLPIDPASDTNVDANETKIDSLSAQLTAAEAAIIAEVDENEAKIDTVNTNVLTIQNNTTTRFVVPTRVIRPTAGTKDYEYHLRLYNTQGMAEAPDADPTIEIRRLDTGLLLDSGTMSQIGVEVGAYKFVQTFNTTSPLVPILVEARVVENGDARLVPFMSEITEFETDLTLLQSSIDDVETIVITNQGLLENPTFGLEAIKDNHAVIIAEVDANEVKIDAVKAKTDNLPADPASETNVDSVEAAVFTRPDINDIQARLDLQEAAIRGVDGRDLTEVYNVFDLTGVAQTSDPRFDFLDADVSSRSTLTAAQVWAHATRELTGLTIPGSEIDKIWDQLNSQNTAVGSIGKLIKDFLDVAVSTRATAADVTGPLVGVAQETTLTGGISSLNAQHITTQADIAALEAITNLIKAKTDNLPGDPASESILVSEHDTTQALLATIDLVVDAIKAKTDNLPPDPAASSEVAPIPTNPLLTTDPRLNNLDALISSRSTLDSGDLAPLAKTTELSTTEANLKAEIDINEGKIDTLQLDSTAIKAKTDNLPADPSSEATLTQGITDIRDDISNIPSSSLTAADVWSFATRLITNDPNDFKADVSGLATSAEVAAKADTQYETHISTVFNATTNLQEVITWVTKDGQRVTGATNATIFIKDDTGATIWTASLSSPNADGVFKLSNTPVALGANKNFYIVSTITADSSPRTSQQPFFTVG